MKSKLKSKIFLGAFLIFIKIPFSSIADSGLNEYTIAVIPEQRCLNKAKAINRTILSNFPDLVNVTNHYHVTLYHASYKSSDISKIKNAIKKLNYGKFHLKFLDFTDTADRWIDWDVDKTNELQRLHEEIVKIANPYHQGPIKRVMETYNDLDPAHKKQIDSYGVTGILEFYEPHMTLFYSNPSNAELKKIPGIIKDAKYENVSFIADKIIIGRLGYNGNVTEILETIPLK